jgi:hypothetical protein
MLRSMPVSVSQKPPRDFGHDQPLVLLLLALLLLGLQGCVTTELWSSLEHAATPVDRSFVLEDADFELARGRRARDCALVFALHPEQCERLSPKWRQELEDEGLVELLFPLDSPVLPLLESPVPDWSLAKIDIQLESQWERTQFILNTTGSVTLRGTLPKDAYARVLQRGDLPSHCQDLVERIHKQGESSQSPILDLLAEQQSLAKPLQRVLERFREDLGATLDFPGRVRGLPTRLEPLAWLDAEQRPLSSQALQQQLGVGLESPDLAELHRIAAHAILGRYADSNAEFYVIAPLTSLWFAARIRPTEQPGLLSWELTRPCFPRALPQEHRAGASKRAGPKLALPLAPGHWPVARAVHRELHWQHVRKDFATGFFEVSWRVLATPVAVAIDTCFVGLYLAIELIAGEDD